MKLRISSSIFWAVVLISLLGPGLLSGNERRDPLAGAQVKYTEEQKIKMLIDHIAGLKNAVFIRNGAEHDAKAAAEHLAKKRKNAGKKIKTAVEFIVNIGSRSSTTGKPYFVKFGDGKTVPSAQVLADELKRIEKENK